MPALPPDVVVALTLRALTRALLASCGAVLALGIVGAAVLALAGETTAVAPGLTLLALGQAAGLVAAVVVGLGLRRVVEDPRGRRTTPEERPAARDSADRAAGDGSADDDDAAAALRTRLRVAARLRRLARLLLAALVTVAAAWTLADPSAALGALVGALVSAQAAVLILAVAGRLTGRAAYGPA